jgi:signal transduction histidine kinase/CheY-like chemotaxis protein
MSAASIVEDKTERGAIEARGTEIFQSRRTAIFVRVDKMFAGLLLGQWAFGVVIALAISPYAWEGRSRSLHEHIYAAIVLGGAIVSLPILLARLRPGEPITRYVIATAQMLFSALLIHLTGGRIETHFHIFGSLAFLAFYRDWKVLIPATIVVASDHLIRQLFWPESVFGISNPESWRFLEHAFWVAFEDVFLVTSCLTGTRELRVMSMQHAEVEALTEREREKSTALDHALEEALMAKREAEEASRIKGQFLANMSHEIRTPLSGVIGMTDLLSRTSLTAKQGQYVRTVKASGTALLSVINDILDLSKIEAGKMELAECVFQLREVLQEVSELVAAMAHSKGLELMVRVADTIPLCVGGDANRLRQVLTNLVGNAVKFTEKGQVEISGRLESETESHVVLRIEVKDSGIGIPEDKLDLLFQAFSQMDNSNSRKFGGTGLGLTISKHIVEMMGGEIGVETKAGVGSTFWFTARLAKRADGAVVGATGASVTLGGVRVLIVDDNPTNLSILRENLSHWDAECTCTTRSSEALHLLATAAGSGSPFQIAILDEVMPDMDGATLAKAIRRDDAFSDMPIVLLTSGSHSANEDPGVLAASMTKPVAPEELRRCLERALSRSSSSRPRPRIEAATARAVPIGSANRPGVLVADDNVVNQQVAMELLEELGYAVDVVSSGMAALEAVAKKRYAVVLMDCQMPEMSGYEATCELRKLENGGVRIPVIAVTAHAMAGDRERALAAGMDDYIPKPLSPKTLREVMDRWTRSRAEPLENGTASNEACLSGEVRRSAKVGKLFLEDLTGRLSRMRECARGANPDVLRREAHTLKGSSLSIGAATLAKICADVEVAPFPSVDTELGRLEVEADRVRLALLEELTRRRIDNAEAP